jgi:hypothetical protein
MYGERTSGTKPVCIRCIIFSNGVIGIATAKAKLTAAEARRWVGQPVCIVLKDRSYYVGWITEVENGGVTLRGRKGRGKISPQTIRHSEKARLAGLFPSFAQPAFGGNLGGNPFGGGPGGGGFGQGLPGQAGAGGGLGGLGGMVGMIGKVWPGIKMGIGMLQTIIPLMGGLKI